MVCSYASLRDDRQMARRPASHVQRQKEAIRKPRTRSEWREAVLLSSGTSLRGRGLSCCAGCIQLDARPHGYFDRQRRVDCSGLRAGSGASAGYPLWVMLAHLASLVPVGNVAVRINFSSAVFAALACAMLTLVVAELLVTASCFAAPRRRNKAARQGSNIESSNAGGLLIFAPAIGAGLLMAFSRTLWSYATITEVYTLNALLSPTRLLFGRSVAAANH